MSINSVSSSVSLSLLSLSNPSPSPTDALLQAAYVRDLSNVGAGASSNANANAASSASASSNDTTSASTATDASTATGASVAISTRAKTMQQLAQLAQDDPDQFKAVTATIAKQLSDAADQGGAGSDFLKKLAARFQAASASGNADDLRPPKPPSDASATTSDGGTAGSTGAAAYRAQARPDDSTRQTIDQIISDALSGVSSTST